MEQRLGEWPINDWPNLRHTSWERAIPDTNNDTLPCFQTGASQNSLLIDFIQQLIETKRPTPKQNVRRKNERAVGMGIKDTTI